MPRIVIVSFGGRRHLRGALDRARRIGHPIHLVAATPSATRGLRTHASRLVTVHAEVGRAGLVAALGHPDTDPVLLLHEDVLLDPAAACRLLAVAADQEELVVSPSSNHGDVDGHVGVLPRDVVQPIGPTRDPVPIERLRASCIAATSQRLHRLVPQRLTAAATRLYVAPGGAVLVGEAVATHVDDCLDSTEPPVGPDARPLLVASMIVRDEQRFLPGCLESLDGLVDRIDVCDTGSVDETRAIATAAGAHVIECDWRDDFAWARNQALSLSRDAWWVLHVDADERVRVADVDAFRRSLATAIHDGEAFDVPLHDLASDGTDVGGMQLPRIFRPDGVHFVGAVHEVPRRTDGRSLSWTVSEQLHIDHLGYQAEVIAERDKQARNLRIARADHEVRETIGTAVQLARSLSLEPDTGREILEVLEPVYATVQRGEDRLNETGQVPVFQLYAKALAGTGRVEEAFEVIEEGRRRYPHSAIVRAVHARLGVTSGRFDEVAEVAGEEELGGGARPWASPASDAARLIELAKSQLATDDLPGAAATVDRLEQSPLLGQLDRWVEVVSLVALATPDDAVDRLLRLAGDDTSGGCIAAAPSVMDPRDAASFAVAVVAGHRRPTVDQRRAALEVVVAAGDGNALDQLVEAIGEDTIDRLWARVSTLPPWVVDWLRQRTTQDHRSIDPDRAMAGLADGDDRQAAGLATWVAADRTLARARLLAQRVPASHAAPVLATAVRSGADDPAVVQVALAVAALAEDHDSVTAIGPSTAVLAPAVVERVVTRSVERGRLPVARAVARLLSPAGRVPPVGPRSDPVVRVLGMHRSGTSAYAGVLRTLGADPGPDDELVPPAPDNPRGFHEHRPLVLAADALLARLGGSWDAPPIVSVDDIDHSSVWAYATLAQLDRLLRRATSPVLWKDPRSCLLLPVWDRVIDPELSVVDVHVVRSPAAVVESLVRRQAFHPEHAARLWVRYVTDQLTHRPDAPLFLAEDLLDDPTSTVERLIVQLELRPEPGLVARAVATVDPDRARRASAPSAPGPWSDVATSMHAAIRDRDPRAAAGLGGRALSAGVADGPGRPLAVLGRGGHARALGTASSPGTVLLDEPDPRSVYEAESLGWRVTDTDPVAAVRLHEPSAVWVSESVDLRDVVSGLLASDPRVPLACAQPSAVVDDVVTTSAAAAWLARPPTQVVADVRIGVVPPTSTRAGVTSVVVPVHGKWAHTDRCLTALHANTGPPIEVIVVDDCSPDDTRGRASQDARVDRVVGLDRNRGFPGAVNAGLAVTTGEYVCVLNNDTEVQPGWLAAMLRELDDGAVLVGPRTNRISGLQQLDDAPSMLVARERLDEWARDYVTSVPPTSWPVDRLVGFCLAARRSLLTEIGGLDEGVGRGNYEDDELCARASRHGVLRVVDDSLVLHEGSVTFGTGSAWLRSMLVGGRHVLHRLGGLVLDPHGVVLGDGDPEGAARSVRSLLDLGIVVTVLERGDVTATRRGVSSSRDPIGVLAADWLDPARGDWETLTGLPARRRIVLLAGEVLEVRDVVDTRRALGAGPCWSIDGVTGVRVVAGNGRLDLQQLLGGDAPRLGGASIVRPTRPER